MIISRVKLKNWRNFRQVDVKLRERQFIVGPNASGKSNLLDIFCFLRDIGKKEGGGLQKAVGDRGGISKLRCLSARKDPEIGVTIEFSNSSDDKSYLWKYEIGIKQKPSGLRDPYLSYERVWHREKQVLDRPDADDKKDPARLQQTFLEQISNNIDFRDIANHVNKITYMHVVPQLLRHADAFQGRVLQDDPFGQNFLINVAKTPERSRNSRLKKIDQALKKAVPKFEKLRFERDATTGRPHIEALYSHWRPRAGWQREDQFSDGTLRLIGFLWSLLEGDSLLLLEEPEQSLHTEIVRKMAPLIYRMQRERKRQVIISTHSEGLLSDPGIDGREILLLYPDKEGTKVTVASDKDPIRELLESGLPPGEVVIPDTAPDQLKLGP